MNELQELTKSLMHRSRACYLTIMGNQRIHAYSMIAGLADLESRLYAWNMGYLAKNVEKAIDTCERCIKTTLLTGRCYKCSRALIEEIDREVSQIPPSKWEHMKMSEE